jgi:DNA helicase TIP49 (TBP-interacting protein)
LSRSSGSIGQRSARSSIPVVVDVRTAVVVGEAVLVLGIVGARVDVVGEAVGVSIARLGRGLGRGLGRRRRPVDAPGLG